MKEIAEKYLNPKDVKVYFDELPKMVASHSKRVMNIAKFILKRLELEDFFAEENINQSSFFDACVFHDVGKLKVKPEYHFRDLCGSPQEVHKYLDHIQFGINIIDDENIEDYIINHPTNFKTYLYEVLKYHHGPVKGKFPVVGQIAYIADTIDNSFFKFATNSIVEFNDKSFHSILDKITAVLEKDRVMPEIMVIFEDQDWLVDLFEFLNTVYKKSTLRTHYGVAVGEYNIYDTYKLTEAAVEGAEVDERNHEIFARKISYDISTRYYGKVKHNDFIYTALKTKFAKKLDSAFFNYVKDSLKSSYEDKPVLTFISLSVDSVNKVTNKRFIKIARELNIDHSHIGVLIDLYYAELTPVQQGAIEELRKLGFKVAINQARAEYINVFKQVDIDYAFYDNSSISKIDEVFVDIVQSLGVLVILAKQTDTKYRYVYSSNTNYRRVAEVKEEEVVAKE